MLSIDLNLVFQNNKKKYKNTALVKPNDIFLRSLQIKRAVMEKVVKAMNRNDVLVKEFLTGQNALECTVLETTF